MSSIIPRIYSKYMNSDKGFSDFHNEVINMPRPNFSHISEILNDIRSLSAYILLVEQSKLSKFNYKELMQYIIEELEQGNYPSEELRSNDFEERYFILNSDINSLYKEKGRMFRHWMGWLLFFNVIKSISKMKKVVDIDKCTEIVLSSEEVLFDVYRSNVLEMNIQQNEFIKALFGKNIKKDADYNPCITILNYLDKVDRPATRFEISILLGRIDTFQTNDAILENALKVAKEFNGNQADQINYFFKEMKWENDGIKFDYVPSQEPYFKFNTFLLLMEAFNLIEMNSIYDTVTLSDYSKQLLIEKLPIELNVLDKLLVKIEDENETQNQLLTVILRNRNVLLKHALDTDSELVVKLNRRSIDKPLVKNNKRIRSRLIKEVAKILNNYTCQATGKPTFKTPKGFNYVEAHHIIEFNAENGPDITDNLLILGPEKHRLLHNACNEEKEDLYRHLVSNGSLCVKKFENMINNYNCLTLNHIDILYNKKIISKSDRDRLSQLVIDIGNQITDVN